MTEPRLSVVVVTYNMNRELPRTLLSLSSQMQVGVTPGDYEIIVVDNGSSQPCSQAQLAGFLPNPRVINVEHPNASPAHAVNLGINAAKGDLIGVLIDGARIASPGLLANALRAARVHPRAVIGTLGFHLGPEVQMASVNRGYNQEVEDRLLRDIAWQDDGYQLFGASVFAGSSAAGWFAPIAESDAIFMSRELWAELGGLDERFIQPGGGLVNLDLFRRACLHRGTQLVIIMGEGTFHQVHGGVATNAQTSPWDQFHDEYVRLRGEPFAVPGVEPIFLGQVKKQVLPSIVQAAANEYAANWRTYTDPHTATAKREEIASELCALSGTALSRIQQAVMQTRYRDKLFLKSPFDIVIYLQLIQRLRPRTVIEIGAKEGGSALWFADVLRAHGIDAHILSVDLSPPKLAEERIRFIQGDARNLSAALSDHEMRSLAHPWLVVEDSAHQYDSSLAVLEFFDRYLLLEDYIVIEDGVVRFLPEEQYRSYRDGPLRAVQAFLMRRGEDYVVDRSLCDFFGPNVTYNPNGYLRRAIASGAHPMR